MTRTKSLAEKLIPWRIWLQTGFLLLWLDPLALRLHNICAPVFHCHACPLATFVCPIGLLAHFSALHLFPFVALGIIIFLGAVFGGFICGWACPFGFLQDLADKIPTPKINLPRWSSYLRFPVLILMVLMIPYLYGPGHPLFFCRLCPAGALEAAVPNVVSQAVAGQEVVWPNTIKLTILILFLVAIFFIYRPWCRLLCPLGAIFGLFNRVSALFLKFNPDTCTSCLVCHDKCKLGILPEKQPSHNSCIRCLDCTRCPPYALSAGSVFNQSTINRSRQ